MSEAPQIKLSERELAVYRIGYIQAQQDQLMRERAEAEQILLRTQKGESENERT